MRLDRLLGGRPGEAGRRPAWLLFAGAAAGVALVAWGQYALGRGAPFQWPLTEWLDRRMDHSFRKDNDLAFAIPLFVAGGTLFALSATRAADAIVRPWRERLPLPLPREVILILVLSIAAWAYVNIRLYFNHYDPGYRWAFLWSAVGILSAVLAMDWMRGVVKRPKVTRGLAAEALLVLAIAGTFIGINVRDIDSWRYAGIGDEGTFYDFGQRALTDKTLNWFSQAGPYGYHPVLSSAWHALNMKVFGSGLFGWKMASVTAIVVTLPAFFWLMREMAGPRAALFGTLVIGASHYLFSYAHTGYNNVFPIPVTVLALACFVSGLKRSSLTLLFLAGALAGLGFYTFYSSRVVIGVIALGIVVLPRRQWSTSLVVTVAAGFVFMALPIFANDRWDVIDEMLNQSATNADQTLWGKALGNAPRTFLAFNYNPWNHHYVAGALMDEISAVLAVAGLFFAIRNVGDWSQRLLLLWFLGAASATGVFYVYDFVAISRLHYVLPPAAAFAGLAIDGLISQVERLLSRGGPSFALVTAVLALLAPVLFFVNGRHFFVYSARHNPTRAETVVIREMASPRCAGSPVRSMAFLPDVEPVLDGTWRFFGLADSRPFQVRLEDSLVAYRAYPSTGPNGCVAMAAFDRQEMTAFRQDLATAPGFQIVTDVSGGTKVAFVPPTDGSPGLSSSDLADAWPRTDPTQSELAGVVQGQERDVIMALDTPRFTNVDAGRYADREPVVAVEVEGEARAYPVRVLIWHVAVNDTLGGTPVLVTFDPISGTPRVFRRDLGGSDLTFGMTGLLRGGNSLLYDRQTESWWQQVTGQAIAGQLSGATLQEVPALLVSWGEFKASFPDGQVLARPDDSDRYERNPYLGYDVPKAKPIFTAAPADERLPAMRRVAVIDVDGRDIAVPFPDASERASAARAVEIAGWPVALLFDWRASSGLDTRNPVDSRSVGTLGAFVGQFEDQQLTFEIENGDRIIDQQTRTRWNSLGMGVEGPETGARLEPLPTFQGFWFAIAAAYPGIELIDPWQ